MAFLENISNFFKKKKKSEAIQLTEVKPIQIKPVEQKEPITLQSGTKAFLEGGAAALPFSEQIKTKVADYVQTKFPQVKQIGQTLIDKYGFKPYEEYQPETKAEKALYTGGVVTSNVAQFVATGKAVDAVMSPILKNLTVISNAGKYGYSAKEALGLIKAAEKATGVSVKATNAIINNAITWGLYQAPRLTGTTTEEKTRQLATAMITGGVFGKLQMVPGMSPLVKYLANALSPFIIKSTVGEDVEGAKDELPAYALMALIPFVGSIKNVGRPGGSKLPAVPGAEFSGGVPPAGVVNPPATIKPPEVPVKSPVAPVQVPTTPEIVRPSPSSEVVVPETTINNAQETQKMLETKYPGISLNEIKEGNYSNEKLVPLNTVKPSQSGEDLYNDTSRLYAEGGYSTFTEKFGGGKETFHQGPPLSNPETLPPIVIDENGKIIDGNHRWAAAEQAGLTEIKVIQKISNPEPQTEVGKTSIAKLEKEITADKFNSYLYEAKDQSDYIKRVTVLKEQLNKPDVQLDVKKLKQVKTLINQELQNLTGNISTGNWKRDFAFYQIIKQDPTLKDQVDVLEDLLIDVDNKIGDGKIKKSFATVERDLSLPEKGKYFITYGKYSTAGTRNREWVQENIPLLYMGNKRGMVGYILDVLGIEQKDLGSIAPEDVKHLKGITNVVDLFGGSGLMSNLSKKFFPNATINYNELDPKTLEAIEKAKLRPKEVSEFVAQIGAYINKNPGADWVQHFKTVYTENEDFRVAAKLLEAAGGRTGEITKRKVSSILEAIPNFSKIFKDVKITNMDALKLMDEYAKTGKPSDLLWVDPPYIWSSGYNVGSTMEGAEGFINILDKLRKLNDQGVKFVFFNNDPEVQVAKAGVQGVYLNNIMGKVNQLSMDGVTVIKDIHPIGTTDRREMMITNLPYGTKSGRLLNIEEVQKAITALKDDPMAAPKELLKLFRDIRGSSRYVIDGKPLSKSQKSIIMSLKKGLRIRNKEMVPMMDELLGDVSLNKMTSIDGQKLIEWLQPKNFEVIEKKIELTRQMNAEERHDAVLGELFAAKNTELEDKFGVLTAMNKTIQEMDNLVKLLKLTPLPKENKNVMRRALAGITGRYISEDLATSIIGIKQGFHTPMRTLINIANNHQTRMKKTLTKVFSGLSKADQKQVVFLQAGAEKSIQGPVSETARKVADYLQEVSEANITLINRIRVARGQTPLVGRKPYIPYIISEDLQMAANLFDRNKFWEARIKTPKDFVAGLFTHDPQRIVDVWSQSMGNWLKKNLYGALLADRMDSLFKVNDAATAYAREMVMLDIYDQLPENEKLYRTVGTAINEAAGKIWPKKIPIDSELAKSVLNTVFGQDLKKEISKGYISIPRVQIPNIASAFHKIFYPAKLAWNFGFGLLNLQQPWSGLPFVGLGNKLRGRVSPFYAMLPFNSKFRTKYLKFLEESGYEFGRIIEGTELAKVSGKIGNAVDRSINFIGDITEFSNRMESMMEATYYLSGLEKKFGAKLSENDKLRIAGRYSGFINFLAGKGYAPLGQRNTLGKFLYIFQQYPINQMNVFFEQWKYATKDEGVKEFWQMMTSEAGGSEEAFKFFENLKKTGKTKTMGLIFLSLLAMVLPVATLYALTRSWNIASRGLPGVPRIVASDLVTAVTEYTNDPSEDTLAKLNQAIKQFFKISATSRLKDSLDIFNTGVIQSGVSKKPIFVQKTLNNAINTLIFGRSALDEYTKRYPTWLQMTMTGDKSAKELKDIQGERAKTQLEETQLAYDIVKKMVTSKQGSDILPYIEQVKKSGKWNDRVNDKVKQYLTDFALDRGGMENAVINLKDSDQARFIYNQLKRLKTGPEAIQKINEFTKLGILTDNVKEELRLLIKQEQLTNLGGIQLP